MEYFDFEQYSPEWYQIRLGIPTASKFDQVVTLKGEPSKQKYAYQLAGEFVAQKAEETYQNAAMARGLELESEARSFYEAVKGVEVQEVGFCMAEGIGCSPDGLVGEKGLIEIKCPKLATHVGYLLKNDSLLKKYFQQVQGQLFVTQRDECDLISYYPGLRPVLINVKRDEIFITKLKVELELLKVEVKEIVEKIK